MSLTAKQLADIWDALRASHGERDYNLEEVRIKKQVQRRLDH